MNSVHRFGKKKRNKKSVENFNCLIPDISAGIKENPYLIHLLFPICCTY